MDFGAEFLDDALRKNTIQGLGDFHLRSALTQPNISSLQSGGGRRREVKSFNLLRKYHKEKICNVSLGILLHRLFTDLPPPKNKGFCFDELMWSLSVEKNALQKALDTRDPFFRTIQILKDKGIASEYSAIKDELSLGLMHLLAKNSKRNPVVSPMMTYHEDHYSHTFQGVRFHYWGELITVEGNSEHTELMTLDHYRMICDKATERDNILVASTMGFKVFPEVYPDPDLLRDIFKCFDEHIQVRGNDGYKLLKTYEALVTGYILTLEDSGYWDSKLFLSSTLDGLDEIDLPKAHEFLSLLAQAKSMHHLTQIGGLFRLWGHPTIEAEAGLEKVKRIAAGKKTIDETGVRASGRAFKELFFDSYFSKHGSYPMWSFINGASDNYLIECLQQGMPFNTRSLEYDWIFWDNINCEKTFDIPETFNLSMIVADTAISPTRKELAQCFQDKIPALSADMRRGVIKWMKDGMIDCGMLLRSINDHPIGLPKNHRAIGLYPKEREMNPVARMFALTTLLLRSYIVVTESMLSDNILPYIPGITMTHPLLQLTKEMIKVTWRQKDSSELSRSFCINMDFEKWNINMRKAATKSVFHQLGRLFGLPEIYNRTYDIFENSIVYLADGSFIPPIDQATLDIIGDDPRIYSGHKGGFEGLRQKGWTIFTVVVIYWICKFLKIDWQLMGQGDNQVLMVTIYSKFARRFGINSREAKEDINRQLKTLINKLISEFSVLGLSLKPLETWVSDTYYSYGKTPLYRGVPCALSLKKISRVFYFSNEDLMTLDNALGAVGANAQSAVMGDIHQIIPYIIAKWQQICCIRIFSNYHPLVGDGLSSGSDRSIIMKSTKTGKRSVLEVHHIYDSFVETVVIAAIPKTLGGYNTVNYFRMMMRGFPDPQNMDFQWLCAFIEACPDAIIKTVLENFQSLMINPDKNFSYLIQDVTGLNLFLPTNSTQTIKDMIHRTIDGLNYDSEFAGWFKTVLKQSEKDAIEPLIEELCKGDELNVRLIHDIVGSTLFGYCDSITSKIDKTVTLSRMALGSEDVVASLIKNELRFFSFFRWRMCVQGNLSYDHKCPSAYIKRAREIGWGKKLIGVDTPFPFHFLTRNIEETDRPDSYVLVMMDDRARSDQSYVSTHVGNALPYLGSHTKEKLGINTQKLSYGNEPLLTRPVKLLRIIGWFIKEESNFANLLGNLVRAVSDLIPEEFIVKQEKVKGSMVHRYNDEGTKHGSLWMPLFGPATFLNLSTNDFVEYSKGSKNVTLHFQALLCYVQYMAVNSLFSESTSKYLKVYRSCKCCIEYVPEEFQDLRDPIDPSLIPTRPENPYLYITKDRIPIEFKAPKTLLSSFPVIDPSDVKTDLVKKCLELWLGNKIAAQLMAGGDSEIDRGLLDIGGVSRTIYLKVDPLEVMDKTAEVLWTIFGRQEKYAREGSYPSWNVVKDDIIRTLSRVPTTQYNLLGGFFLWAESKALIESSLNLLHSSYPMTASSIARSSREAMIKIITAKRSLSLPHVALILPGAESSMESLIKMVMIRRLDPKIECPSCIKAILEVNISTSGTLMDISWRRCKIGHHLLDQNLQKWIKRTNSMTVEAVFDILPNLPYKEKILLSALPQYSFVTPTKDRHVPILSDKDLPFPDVGVTGFPEFDIKERYTGLGLKYGSITRGYYRAGELSMKIRGDHQGNLLILGDGYGGTSLGFHIFGKWRSIHAWTYLDISSGIPHSSKLSRPPLHFNFDTLIDFSHSLERNSLVGTKNFSQEFQEMVSENQIDTIISDIEWWYVGEDKTQELIRIIHETRINRSYIRVFSHDVKEMLSVVDLVSQMFGSWGIFFTDSCSPMNKSAWMFMSKRKRVSCIRPFDISKCQYIYDQLYMGHQGYMYDATAGKESLVIDKLLSNVPTLHKCFSEMIVDFFRDVGMIDFLSWNFTRLYLGLRTSRRPQSVMHMAGNTLYYDREEGRHKVMVRLLLLACSMIQSTSTPEELLDRHWELIWIVENYSSFETQRYVKTNILLQSSIRQESNLTKKEKREILSQVALLRHMRENFAAEHKKSTPMFLGVGKSITFKYVPEKQFDCHRNSLFFPISKVLSYNTIS